MIILRMYWDNGENWKLLFRIHYGYCPHPVTVHIRGPIKGYIYPYYNYYPTVTEGGQYPRFIMLRSKQPKGTRLR